MVTVKITTTVFLFGGENKEEAETKYINQYSFKKKEKNHEENLLGTKRKKKGPEVLSILCPFVKSEVS